MELKQKVISAANAVRLQRYSDAEVVYAAGSFIRGDATAYSDLDLVVIYKKLPNAYRESFRFDDIPVEAFVHDPETLNYFFLEVDRSSGIPALMRMVVEGVEVPEPSAISKSLKKLATDVIDMGPPELNAEERQKLRYGITDLIDDIRDPRSYEELVAAGSRLYEAIANYYFRRNGMWSASGKSIPRALALADQDLSAKFSQSFQKLFGQGDPAATIALAGEILLQDGGFLFDGHRGEAPASWRKPLSRTSPVDFNPELESARSLMFVTKRPNVTFVRGEGAWLYDTQGRRYLDFLQGWAVNSLGHSPRLVRDALAAQAAQVINVSPQYYNEPMCRLAGLLTRLSGLDRVFFTNSGAEANEGAIKLARKWGSVKRSGAYEIIVFDGAFHGRTLATMSASGKPQWKDLFEPKVPGFIRVPPEDPNAVRKAIGPKTAAVMLEPIQGESGVHPFSLEFLRGLRELTQELGVLLILDEIQTGIGRTGRMFCFEHAGIQPDLMTLGKGIGGGVPLAALLAREEVSVFEAGDQGGTFNGNPLMTAVGCAVVEEVSRPDFLKGVRENGEYLSTQLRALSRDFGLGDVRGYGLLLALDLGREIGPKVVDAALAQGLLINSPRPTTLRFVPALNVTRAEIDQMTGILREAIQSVD